MTPAEQIQITQITRVLEAQGWNVVAVDGRGSFLQIVATRPKPDLGKVVQ